jgi:hypothetical protein
MFQGFQSMRESSDKRSAEEAFAGELGVEMISPPSHAARLELTVEEGSLSQIEYEHHPAYESLVAATTPAGRLAALAIFLRYLVVVVGKRALGYELIPAHLRRPRSVSAVGELLLHVLRRAVPSGQDPAGADHPSSKVLDNLRRDGCCVIVASAGDLEAIASASASAFSDLRGARGSKEDGRAFMESRTQVLRDSGSSLFEVIDACFRNCGVLQSVSAYRGRKVRLIDVNPQINDRSDDFWKRAFPDMGSPVPRTAYLHKDASGGDIKVMIYLSDVGPANGPFSFVLNSHSYARSQRGDWVEETNDYAGFSGTDRWARSQFASLPRGLRRKCAFGNDIQDDDPISRRLLESEWRITGRRGTVVVFDPKGFHRGGMVEAGERLVITCTIG